LEVGPVPPSEGVVDGIRELLERVGARCGEDAPRPGPEVLAVPLDEVHADGQPAACHGVTRPPVRSAPTITPSMPGTALSVDEREEIRLGLEAGDAFAELARALDWSIWQAGAR